MSERLPAFRWTSGRLTPLKTIVADILARLVSLEGASGGAGLQTQEVASSALAFSSGYSTATLSRVPIGSVLLLRNGVAAFRWTSSATPGVGEFTVQGTTLRLNGDHRTPTASFTLFSA